MSTENLLVIITRSRSRFVSMKTLKGEEYARQFVESIPRSQLQVHKLNLVRPGIYSCPEPHLDWWVDYLRRSEALNLRLEKIPPDKRALWEEMLNERSIGGADHAMTFLTDVGTQVLDEMQMLLLKQPVRPWNPFKNYMRERPTGEVMGTIQFGTVTGRLPFEGFLKNPSNKFSPGDRVSVRKTEKLGEKATYVWTCLNGTVESVGHSTEGCFLRVSGNWDVELNGKPHCHCASTISVEEKDATRQSRHAIRTVTETTCGVPATQVPTIGDNVVATSYDINGDRWTCVDGVLEALPSSSCSTARVFGTWYRNQTKVFRKETMAVNMKDLIPVGKLYPLGHRKVHCDVCAARLIHERRVIQDNLGVRDFLLTCVKCGKRTRLTEVRS